MTGGEATAVDLPPLPIAQAGESLAGKDSSYASCTVSTVSAVRDWNFAIAHLHRLGGKLPACF